MLYGARTPADILYQQELLQWRRNGVLNVEVTVDAGDAEWRGDVGVVTNLLPRVRGDAGNTVAMICGPEIMMRYSAKGLLDLGLAPERILVSMERNMKCATAFCGHCQIGPHFVCKDGPVFPYPEIAPFLLVREF